MIWPRTTIQDWKVPCLNPFTFWYFDVIVSMVPVKTNMKVMIMISLVISP
jgi:hypothetical protein